MNETVHGFMRTTVRNACFLKYQGKGIPKQLLSRSLVKKLNKPIFKIKVEKFVTAVAGCSFLGYCGTGFDEPKGLFNSYII